MPAIAAEQMPVVTTPGGTTGPRLAQWISEVGGLTQFGAYVETLPPNSYSATKHWHANEDEMVFVLEGAVTLIEGTTETLLQPGDAATFKAGVAVGHHLHNRGATPSRCLILGTRAARDVITYPDHDRVCHRDRGAGTDRWTDGAGNATVAL